MNYTTQLLYITSSQKWGGLGSRGPSTIQYVHMLDQKFWKHSQNTPWTGFCPKITHLQDSEFEGKGLKTTLLLETGTSEPIHHSKEEKKEEKKNNITKNKQTNKQKQKQKNKTKQNSFFFLHFCGCIYARAPSPVRRPEATVKYVSTKVKMQQRTLKTHPKYIFLDG